ncbi:MAG: 4-(cytidine 5'-diphospho)-2-C-methyl-D-erythritol kinase [Methylotetracoccus sp.]
MTENRLRLPAPAKLNLMLRVVGRRPDGYHLLQTVFQFIDASDWISLAERSDDAIRLLTPLPGVPEESDLTVRAARALQAWVGGGRGVDIVIEKNLPMGGGLGGGSSDAATVLAGLVSLWNVAIGDEELARLGLSLGADVPVFLFGRSAWGEGVGERLTALDLPEPYYLVIVPRCHVSTADVFRHPGLTRDNKPVTMADFVAGSHDNHCLAVVTGDYPLVREALADLASVAEEPRLTGTGACVFAEFATRAEAADAAERLRPKWDCFVARGLNTSPLLAALGRSGPGA